MPHPKPHQTEGEGGAVVFYETAQVRAGQWVRDADGNNHQVQRRPIGPREPDSGWREANDWWRLHPEGMA